MSLAFIRPQAREPRVAGPAGAAIGREDVTFPKPETVVAVSDGMVEICEYARRAALGNAKVLITGERGSGKEVLARYVHAQSPRALRPFVAVACAGKGEAQLESELFGHMKGAFTAAYRDSAGRLQLANRGTVFLDEVGGMSLRVQALLSRFLEHNEIQPVGAPARACDIDVRVIAATSEDLWPLVQAGAFREDLFYRLHVVHLHLPPLRERRADIRPLIAHLAAGMGLSLRFTESALERLESYSWPGNGRELRQVIADLRWRIGSDPIGPEDLGPSIAASERQTPAAPGQPCEEVNELYEALVSGQARFWDAVHRRFLERDLTREHLRALVRRGLADANGSYRALLTLFGLHHGEYKRFINFLTTHRCAVDFRDFRRPARQDR